MNPARIAVVGAGIAGLSAARALRSRGDEVTVFDKGRSVGGRVATRRAGARKFDHGAQFFTARDARFREVVDELRAAGRIAIWPGPFRTVQAGARGPDPRPGAVRYVGVPGMSALSRSLAEGVDVRSSHRVAAMSRRGSHWWVRCELPADGPAEEEGPFDVVVLAVPPPQVQALLPATDRHGPVGVVAERLRPALQPCLCAMVTFARSLPEVTGGYFVVDDDVLGWAAHDGGKPQRPDDASYVLHGTAEWSAANLEQQPDDSAAALLAAFGRALAVELPPVTHLVGHRWAFALADGEPLDAACVLDRERGLALVGDALAGGRVEGAFVSGLSLAEQLAAALG